jgi:hypothetical protein
VLAATVLIVVLPVVFLAARSRYKKTGRQTLAVTTTEIFAEQYCDTLHFKPET